MEEAQRRTSRSRLLTFVILLVTFHGVTSDCSCLCNSFSSSDLAFLLDVKSNITEDPFDVLTSWSESLNCSTGWMGVSCDSNGRVTCLQLSSKAFAGSISSSVGGLTALTNIYLYNNSFSGSIPTSLGNLALLNNLHLSQNMLSGSIPSSFGTLTNLVQLYLNSNKLTGTIPSSLGELTNLTELALSFNKLSGPLPSSLGQLSNLQIFYFNENAFNGSIPSSLGNLTSVKTIVLSNNNLTGSIPSSITGLPNITSLFLGSNFLSGTLPTDIGNLQSLTILDVGYNSLVGPIPTSLGSLTNLETLQLSTNSLSGTLPASLGNLSALISASLFSNYFYGSIPPEISGPCRFNLSGNCLTVNTTNSCVITSQKSASACAPYCDAGQSGGSCGGHGTCSLQLPNYDNATCLCDEGFSNSSDSSTCIQVSPASTPPPAQASISPPQQANVQPPPPGKGSNVVLVVAVAAGVLVAILFLSTVIYCCFCFGAKKDVKEAKEEEQFLKCLTFEEIVVATNNFAVLIGEGGYGKVYKAESPTGQLWAVKRATNISSEGTELFKKEINIISRMSHVNILSLRAYCDQNSEQILVYDFMENGNLKHRIRVADSKQPPLTFPERVKIALGSADGLLYLHHQARPTIIHRDVKSENILLDGNLTAHIADFGFLKEKDFLDSAHDSQKSTMKIVGTPGYIDPETFVTLKATPKSDVYSFGVVLLELITGHSAVYKDPNHPNMDLISLVQYVNNNGWDLEKVIDNSLKDFDNNDAMIAFLDIARKCVKSTGAARPSMQSVVYDLVGVSRLLDPQIGSINIEEEGDKVESFVGYETSHSSFMKFDNASAFWQMR